jgi:SNF2-related domain
MTKISNETSVLRKFLMQSAPPKARGRRPIDEDSALNRKQRRASNLKRTGRNRRQKILEKRSDYPRLTDPDAAKDLVAEYLPFTKKAYAYYSQIAAITAYLRAHLNDRTIIANNNIKIMNNSGIPTPPEGKPDAMYKEFFEKTTAALTSPGRILKFKGDEVQLNVAPANFEITCKLNAETAPILQQKLGKLFRTDFKIPTQYTRNDKNEIVAVLDKNYETGLRPIDYYMRLKYVQDEAPGYYQPQQLATVSGGSVVTDVVIDNRLKDITTIEVVLKSANVFDSNYAMSSSESGSISQYAIVRFNFQVEGIVTFPMEYALWATNATQKSEFVPKLFREHFDAIGRVALGLAGGKFEDMFSRTMHVGKVKELNAKRIIDYSIKVKPRVNADNFCILSPSGRVFYVPPTDKSDFYIKKLQESYDEETGIVKSNSEIKEVYNIPLLVDWINDGFAYTNDSGAVQSVRLVGAVPLDEVTIANDLANELINYDKKFIKEFGERGHKFCQEFNLYDTAPTADTTIATNFETLTDHILRFYSHLPYHQMVADAAKSDTDKDLIRPRDKPLIQAFVKLCAGIAKNIIQSTNYALYTRCLFIYTYHLFGIYVGNYKSYYDAKLAAQEENTPIPSDQLPTKFAIPNLPGVETVLPHQAGQVAQSTIKAPKFIVLDVSAGGGKTFLMLTHIVSLKQQGKIETAVIVCPGRLVSEWTNEVNRMSRGAINIVPINSEVIRKMVKDLSYDRQKYLTYMKKAPPNTIFVISLNFLRLTTDYFTGERLNSWMQFGEQYIKFFPNVQLLRQLEPDIIILDESHYAKNADSNRAKAIASFAPCSDMRGVASGTIMQNDPSDMPAQYGLINPTILGTKENFQDTYGVTENGKFVGLKAGMEGQIAIRRRPYLFAVNKSRRDWSQLLPDIEANIWPVPMTMAQKEFYDDILQDKIAEMMADPEVKDLLKKQDEANQEKLEKLLEKELNVVEQFVSAPDMNPSFTVSSKYKVEQRDLRSAKSVKADELIAHHLATDPNKILVFCYNKAVSIHFWRHTRFQHLGLHYAASDKTEPRKNETQIISGTEALMRFRQDDRVKILFADETSLSEGFNLQMASRIIRVQTLYAPGKQEQSMSRAMRPDVMDVYGREKIWYDWLVTNQSHEVGKAARMIAKQVIIHRKKEEDNPQWTSFTKNTPIQDLKLVRLNLDMLRDPRKNTIITSGPVDDQYMTEDSAFKEYFDSYEVINNWEVNQFRGNRQRLRASVAKRLGVDPQSLTEAQVRKESQIPLDGSGKLPGTKSIWVPLANGSMPIDIRNLNIKPLAVLEKDPGKDDDDEEDDDDSDEAKGKQIDITTYLPGDMVQTEYGFGTIVSTQVKQVKVQVNGVNGNVPFGINKQVVFKATPPTADTTSKEYRDWEKRVKKLKDDYEAAGEAGLPFIEGTGIAPVVLQAPRPRQEPVVRQPPPRKPPMIVKRDEDEPDADEDEDEKPTPRKQLRNIPQHAPKPSKTSTKRRDTGKRIFVDTMIVNGIPTLQAYADEDGFAQLENYGKWNRVVPFYNARIRTYNGAVNLIKFITRNFPDVELEGSPTQKNLKNLLLLAKKMQSASSTGLRVRRPGSVPMSAITNFMKVEHTVAKSEKYIKIFPVIYDNYLFACIPIQVQRKQAQIMRRATITGVDPFKLADEVMVYFGTTTNDIIKRLNRINDNERLSHYNETMERLRDPDYKRMVGPIS